MPPLDNPRHERFAQAVAAGRTCDEAYVAAGYRRSRQNAARLMSNDDIRRRVEDILRRGAARAEVTVERVVREMARLAFSDIRRVVRWGEAIAVRDSITGEVTIANGVALIGADDLDAEAAACIAEISQTKDGALKVKLHDKRAALVDLGRHLGVFNDKLKLQGDAENPLTVLLRDIQGNAIKPVQKA